MCFDPRKPESAGVARLVREYDRQKAEADRPTTNHLSRSEDVNETKHTPGPWVYAPDAPHYSHAPYQVWTSLGPGHGTVAQTCSSGLMPTAPERQAEDARLIAASPDMLAACIEAERWLSTRLGPAATESCLPSLRAAIAKATGN